MLSASRRERPCRRRAHHPDRLRDGRTVVGRPGDRPDVRVERRDDHPVALPQRAAQAFGGEAHEVHRARHALAVVDERAPDWSARLARHQVDFLRHAILAGRERGRFQVGDETPGLVVDAGFEQDAPDLGLFSDFERRKHDRVADQPPAAVRGLDENLALLERVLVHPVDG